MIIFHFQVATRSFLQQTVPNITLRLDLEKTDSTDSIFLQTSPSNLIHMKDKLENVLKQNQNQWIRKMRRKIK